MRVLAGPHRRRWPAFLTAARLLVLAARCLRPDEMHCENAVARLADCCPGFDAHRISCEYVEGCGARYPTIPEDDARCIAGKSCDALVSDGTCAVAQGATPQTSFGGSYVCR